MSDLPHTTTRRPVAGFTLIEALVVIGIISVILGILLPTLAMVRRDATTLQCKARLASIGKLYEMYAADHRGRLPTHEYAVDAQGVADPLLVPEWGVGGGGWLILPVSEINFWGYNLRGYVVDDPDRSLLTAVEQLSCPVIFREWFESLPLEQQEGAVQDPMASPQASYSHSVALFTSPGAWSDPDSPPDVNRAHAPVQLSQVAAPSTKTNLVETASHHERRRVRLDQGAPTSEQYNLLAVDGHVQRRSARDAREPAGFVADRTGLERPRIDRDQFADSGIPYISTQRGALGRDW